MFITSQKTKQIKRMMKQLGMEYYAYNGYLQDHDVMYMSKTLGDGNYLLASYVLDEINGKVMPSYGTRIDLLDAFMCAYLKDGNITTVLDKLNEEVKPLYKFELPKVVKTNKSIKNILDNGYKVIYARDNSEIEKSLIKTIDVYFVNETEGFYSFKSVHFVQSIDSVKKGDTTNYLELDGHTINVPKFIIEK